MKGSFVYSAKEVTLKLFDSGNWNSKNEWYHNLDSVETEERGDLLQKQKETWTIAGAVSENSSALQIWEHQRKIRTTSQTETVQLQKGTQSK